jgi:hypothetical protein
MNDGMVSYLPVSPVGPLRERVVSAIDTLSSTELSINPLGQFRTRTASWSGLATTIIHKSQLQAAGLSALLNPV